MAQREEIIFNLKMTSAEAEKSLEKVKKNISDTNKEVKDSINNFGLFGVTVGDVKNKFGELRGIASKSLSVIKQQGMQAALGLRLMFGGKMKMGASALFKTIKVGIASTGIGLFLVAIGSLTQFFRDSEEGASKLKEMTSQLGVAFGNVTDIISNLGKGLFSLLSGDFEGMKKAFAEATDQVMNFGEQTRKEMADAKQLEKDRLALQQFERKAAVDAAKTNSEIMKLRLQARDIEMFTAQERLAFMREANKLADEQLQKDLHVANEKLRFQEVENSFSKSTQENLDAEAQLQVRVHEITRSNFSERKRMKSEEQALVRELAAIEKSARNEAQKDREQAFKDAEKFNEELFKSDEERVKKETAAAKKAAAEKVALDKAVADSKIAAQNAALSAVADIFGRESQAGKAAAVAQATMNTYQAANNALANTPAPPPFPFIAAGITVAAGLQNVSKILNTPNENKFAQGGMVGGIGTGTSDSVSARLSKGESVINARSTRMFKPLLSAMNEAGGGRGFADGGTVDDGLGGVTGGVVKAYVLSDEMTSNQDRLAKIRRKATI